MAANHVLPVLWSVFDRLLVSHVLSRSIQPSFRRGRFSGTHRELCLDATFRRHLHFYGGNLYASSFSGQCFDFHDGIRLGTT